MSVLVGVRNRLALRWGGTIASALQPVSATKGGVTVALWLALVWTCVFGGVVFGLRPLAGTLDFASYLILNLFAFSVAAGGAALVAKRMAAYLLSEVMLMRMLAWYRNPGDEYAEMVVQEISRACQDPIPVVRAFFLHRRKNRPGRQEVHCHDWRTGPLYHPIRHRIETKGGSHQKKHGTPI